MTRVGLHHTDAVGVLVHPSLQSGTPTWGVAAFYAATVVGSLAWVQIAKSVVARFAATCRRNRRA